MRLFCVSIWLTYSVPYYYPTKNIALIVLERLYPVYDLVFNENQTD